MRSSVGLARTSLSLSEDDIESLLNRVLSLLDAEPALIEIEGSDAFVGDTHGDVETTRAVLSRYSDCDRIVFLGDYIDREPEAGWSLENILTLLQAKLDAPSKIILLKGNHEANAIIPCFPCEFDREIARSYSQRLSDLFTEVFNALPLMVRGHRIFAAHGGFPTDASLEALQTTSKTDRNMLEAILWSDPVMSKTFRGVGQLFTEDELLRFLKRINASVFLRGHDYQRLGESIYEDHCLTIFSARQYQTMGNKGILIAHTDHDVTAATQLQIDDYSTGTWRPYTAMTIED